MRDVLFLAHRIPYPPNKGDKIRSWNVLRFLASRYRIHLACFVDDEDDWQHVPFLKTVCSETYFAPLRRTSALIRSLPGLVDGRALTLLYYYDPDLARWVDATLSRLGIERIFVFSSAMAQYVSGERASSARRIMDFVDVDSDKWRQYAERKPWPLNWIYGHESRALLAFERGVAAAFDLSLFVSQHEADLFRSLAPEVAHKVLHVNNGVDFRFYAPDQVFENPYRESAGPGPAPVLTFTGAMDYWANVDAVTWFVADVFPGIRRRLPDVRFYIVGAKPSAAVRRLARTPGVFVTGRVPDVRPYLAHATAVVAPLRVARGIQNKVLEAMAMAKAVVATPQALEGLGAAPGREIVVAGGASEFAHAVTALLEADGDTRRTVGGAARAHVLAHHDWDSELACLARILH
ncbi:MAG: TIGR03087 family PEP-CTERM/XrtA system glycosyltransferase [Alphaproteobacteria bacterium]